MAATPAGGGVCGRDKGRMSAIAGDKAPAESLVASPHMGTRVKCTLLSGGTSRLPAGAAAVVRSGSHSQTH